MACSYIVLDNGNQLTLKGMPELKAWLHDNYKVNKPVKADKPVQNKPAKVQPLSTAKEITDMLPKSARRLIEEGKLKVVQSVDDLPESIKGDEALKFHKVWHGSPHDHDGFDMSKVNTGEGATAQGYGLYFASDKGIAEWYRKKLTQLHNMNDGIVFIRNGEEVSDYGYNGFSKKPEDIERAANQDNVIFSDIAGHIQNGETLEGAYLAAKAITETYNPKMSTWFDKNPLSSISLKKNGALYEVDLKNKTNDYLVWDKPLSKQYKKVTDILKNNDLLKEIPSHLDGELLYKKLSEKLGGDKQASDYLYSIGIKGTKYLDGNTREGGKPSYNYVIFNDKDASITNKYSKEFTGAEALYDERNDQLYLIADQLHNGNLENVLNHELLHRAEATDPKLKSAIGKFEADLQQRFNLASKGVGTPIELEAYKRVVSAETPLNDQMSEFRAYMVTEYSNKPQSFTGKIKRIFDDLIAAIRVALIRAGVNLKSLSPADLLAMSKYGARVNQNAAFDPDYKDSSNLLASKNDNGVKFSRASTNPNQSTLPNIPPTSGNFNLPKETGAQKQQRLWQDSDNRWKVVQQSVMDQFGNLNENNDVYRAMERMPGHVAAKMEDFQRGTVDKLMKRIADLKSTTDDVALFLYANHAPERNAQIALINPRFPDGGSGMTNADAAATIAELKAHYGDKYADFENLARDWQGVTDNTLKMLENSGTISADQAQAYKQAYSDYIPLKGFEKITEDNKQSNGTGIGNSTGRNFSKRALGRESKAGQIIENIVRDHERAIIWAEKSAVGEHVANFVESNPDESLWTINKMPQQRVLNANPKPHGMVAFRDAQFDPEKEIQFTRNGEVVRIQLHDPLLLKAYNNLGMQGISTGFKITASFNRMLRQFWTAKNPAFFFINPIRDLQQLGVVMTGEGGVTLAVKSYGHWGGAWKAMLNHGSNKNAGQWQQWVDRYRQSGGHTGAAYVGSVEQMTDKLENQMKRMRGDSVFQQLLQGDPVKAAKTFGFKAFNNRIFDVIENLNSAFENATRLAAFRASVESGMTDNEAGRVAKNVSVNFNRHGELGQNLGALYLFANANIQGTQNLYRTLTESKHNKQAWALVGAMVAAGFMAGMLEDEDDDKVPDFEKERNLSFEVGEGKRVTIPLAYGWSWFRDLGRAMSKIAKGEDSLKVSMGLASSFMGNFSPVGNPMVNGKLDAKSAIVSLAPTSFKLPLMAGTNTNSFGSQLMPESPFKPNQPDSEKVYRKTRGTAYDYAAKELNKLTGGDSVKAGWMDVSPETLKATVGFITGGAGRFLTDSASMASTAISADEPMKPETWPIVKAFFKSESIDDYRRVFYEQADQVALANEQRKGYIKAGDLQAAKESPKEFRLFKTSEMFKKRMKAIRDQEDITRNNESLTGEVRQQKLEVLEKREQALLTLFDKQFKAVAG